MAPDSQTAVMGIGITKINMDPVYPDEISEEELDRVTAPKDEGDAVRERMKLIKREKPIPPGTVSVLADKDGVLIQPPRE